MLTSDPAVVEPNDLSDIFRCVDRVENWRRSQDMIYRLLTAFDAREMNECVLGLVSSGQGGASIGLLRSRYVNTSDCVCASAVAVLDEIESDILGNDMGINDEVHRLTCHYLILIALVIEPVFVNYVILKTHNRQSMRYFVNEVLRKEMVRMLMGGAIRGERSDAFGVHHFVCESRYQYALYCTPSHLESTI